MAHGTIPVAYPGLRVRHVGPDPPTHAQSLRSLVGVSLCLLLLECTQPLSLLRYPRAGQLHFDVLDAVGKLERFGLLAGGNKDGRLRALPMEAALAALRDFLDGSIDSLCQNKRRCELREKLEADRDHWETIQQALAEQELPAPWDENWKDE